MHGIRVIRGKIGSGWRRLLSSGRWPLRGRRNPRRVADLILYMKEREITKHELTERKDFPSASQTFLIPIPSLTVGSSWKVGAVAIHPASELDKLAEPTMRGVLGSFERQALTRLRAGSIAEVSAATPELAIEAARGAVDVLRVFSRWYTKQSALVPDFGLVSVHEMQPIMYLVADGTGAGFHSAGKPYGFELPSDAEHAWSSEPAFAAVADAINQAPGKRSEGLNRAVLGTRLLARALSEPTAEMQLVGFITALEAFLMQEDPGRYRLARHASYLTCFLGADWRCRERESPCVFLTIEPNTRARREQLKSAADGPADWVCAIWSRYDRWYQRRSALVHGKPVEIDPGEVRRATHWLVGYALPEILRWLIAHPDDPIGGLEAALGDLPPTSDQRWPPHVRR